MSELRDFNEGFYERLQDKEFAEIYLKGAIEDFLEDGAFDEFLLAIHDLVESGMGFSELAKITGSSRTSLYKSLSGKTSPSFETVIVILKALGYQLDFKPVKKGSKPKKPSPKKPTKPHERAA